ncbi:MAG TPA: hypothetical protein VGV37_08850 [Aliidongia sp.]|nr:hypothetical protein [Aliidongia sp.]HEV2674637.1 hypothetical protein [Aliidongia sp.]
MLRRLGKTPALESNTLAPLLKRLEALRLQTDIAMLRQALEARASIAG